MKKQVDDMKKEHEMDIQSLNQKWRDLLKSMDDMQRDFQEKLRVQERAFLEKMEAQEATIEGLREELRRKSENVYINKNYY